MPRSALDVWSVVAITFALQGEDEGINEQFADLRRVSGDNRHVRDEANVHVAQTTGRGR
jgi:hypothetical protein